MKIPPITIPREVEVVTVEGLFTLDPHLETSIPYAGVLYPRSVMDSDTPPAPTAAIPVMVHVRVSDGTTAVPVYMFGAPMEESDRGVQEITDWYCRDDAIIDYITKKHESNDAVIVPAMVSETLAQEIRRTIEEEHAAVDYSKPYVQLDHRYELFYHRKITELINDLRFKEHTEIWYPWYLKSCMNEILNMQVQHYVDECLEKEDTVPLLPLSAFAQYLSDRYEVSDWDLEYLMALVRSLGERIALMTAEATQEEVMRAMMDAGPLPRSGKVIDATRMFNSHSETEN